MGYIKVLIMVVNSGFGDYGKFVFSCHQKNKIYFIKSYPDLWHENFISIKLPKKERRKASQPATREIVNSAPSFRIFPCPSFSVALSPCFVHNEKRVQCL